MRKRATRWEKSEISAAVGRVLEKHRLAKGWSRREASVHTGVAGHQSVQSHETGVTTITVDCLVRYCRTYGVDPLEVLAEALATQAAGGDPSE